MTSGLFGRSSRFAVTLAPDADHQLESSRWRGGLFPGAAILEFDFGDAGTRRPESPAVRAASPRGRRCCVILIAFKFTNRRSLRNEMPPESRGLILKKGDLRSLAHRQFYRASVVAFVKLEHLPLAWVRGTERRNPC